MNGNTKIIFLDNNQSLEAAIDQVQGELMCDRETYVIRHSVGPNQGFPVHRHLTTNEWIMVHDASFEFVTHENENRARKIIDAISKTAICFVPIGICHTIRSRNSGFKYAVLKDGPDDFNLCRCNSTR